jgi:hypothetical protein
MWTSADERALCSHCIWVIVKIDSWYVASGILQPEAILVISVHVFSAFRTSGPAEALLFK